MSSAHCKFPATPSYFFDVVGDSNHWQLAGTLSVARPTPKGFRIILLHPSIRGATLLASAKKLKWVISWIGNIGSNCGETKAKGVQVLWEAECTFVHLDPALVLARRDDEESKDEKRR